MGRFGFDVEAVNARLPEDASATGSDRPRVLAIASGGGHWVQLLRIAAGFEGCDVAYATVNRAYRSQIPRGRFHVINDATRWNRFALLMMALRLAWIIWREKPDVVVSTGAAP